MGAKQIDIRFAVSRALWLVIAAAAMPVEMPAAEFVFEADAQSTEGFELLDLSGDASMQLVADATVPPGFGPNTLEFRGNHLLVLAKTSPLTAGTILVLWQEADPRNFDADGVILFAAKYDRDLAEAHNTKKLAAHIWLEQDTDEGFQFRCIDPSGKEQTAGEVSGLGLTTAQWNKVGWFWQKVAFDGKRLQAKFWSVVDPEPERWLLTADPPFDTKGRIGLRAASGRFRVAYFAASTHDLPARLPKLYLHSTLPRMLPQQTVVFRLFAAPAVAEKTAGLYAVIQPPAGQEQKWPAAGNPFGRKTSFELPVHLSKSLRSALEQAKSLSPKQRAERIERNRLPSYAEWVLDHNWPTLDALQAGRYRITLTANDSNGRPLARDVRTFDVYSTDRLKARVTRINQAVETARKLAQSRRRDGVDYRDVLLSAATAERLLELVERRITAGQLDDLDKPLTYAEDALRPFSQLLPAPEPKKP